MLEQRTIDKEVSVTGIGIHSGKKVRLNLRPAPVDYGIVFDRIDLPNEPKIKALARNVVNENNTYWKRSKCCLHCRASCHGLGIDNIICVLMALSSNHGWSAASFYLFFRG